MTHADSARSPFVAFLLLALLVVSGGAHLGADGGVLARVTIGLAHVVIEPDVAGPMPAGEFLAVTARGEGEWGPEVSRVPDASSRPGMVSADLEGAAAAAGARWGYTRVLGANRGSVTLLFTRRVPGR
jgi:hypothetical protein